VSSNPLASDQQTFGFVGNKPEVSTSERRYTWQAYMRIGQAHGTFVVELGDGGVDDLA
jgi:hypothetical protein